VLLVLLFSVDEVEHFLGLFLCQIDKEWRGVVFELDNSDG